MISRRNFLKSTPSFSSLAFPLLGLPFASPRAVRTLKEEVVPRGGIATPAAFGGTIQKLVASGVLNPDKYRALYQHAGGIPSWVEDLLARPSEKTIVFSPVTAPYLLNLLWPLGLATRTGFNERSPLETPRIPVFASTGGWTLARARNGFGYFNRVHTLRFDLEQEARAYRVAVRTFRPCCDNSTFFQDCNHGSALLGLIELAASQGLSEEQIERTALIANSYWFPDNYVGTALYFSQLHGKSWASLSPRRILSADFSSFSGWQQNVHNRLAGAGIASPVGLADQLACGI